MSNINDTLIDGALLAFESDISYIEDIIKAATKLVEKRSVADGSCDMPEAGESRSN